MKFQYRNDELERHAVKVVSTDGWEADAVILLSEAAPRFSYRRHDFVVTSASLDATARSEDTLKKTLSAPAGDTIVLIATVKVYSYMHMYSRYICIFMELNIVEITEFCKDKCNKEDIDKESGSIYQLYNNEHF